MKKKVFLWILVFLLFVYITSTIAVKISYRSIESLKDADSRFVSVCGINVHYKVYGNKPLTLLMIHGFGASVYSFEGVAGELSRDFTVVALDLPGFGLTERVSKNSCSFDPYSRKGQVEVVKNFIECLDLKEVYVLGHSMGGTVAALLAINYPQMVKGLILEDAAIFEQSGSPSALRYILGNPVGRYIFTALAYPVTLSLQGLVDRAFHNKSLVTPERIAGYKKSLRVKNWDYGLYRILIADNSASIIDNLGKIKIPTLVITGENDAIVKEENSQKLSSMISDARYVVISECGHIPHEEKPEAFIHAVRIFIKGGKTETGIPSI